jgi:probable HAF family extracellular repeat protein
MLMFGASHSLGAATYRYQDLGTLYGKSWAGGINWGGQVVGYSETRYDANNNEPHAFLAAAPGRMQDLGTLAGGQASALGFISGANGINSSGQVVGWSSAILPDGSFTQRAFFRTTAGAMQDLGTLGGSSAGATAINNNGQVVGWSSIILPGGTPQHAFLWTAAGGMQDLGAWGGDSWAYGINSSGQVVGAAATVSPGGTSVQHAFLWTAAGGLQDLGTLGGNNSSASGINDRGQIVGAADTAAGQAHAFLRTAADSMQDLGTLGGSSSGACAINNNGKVVGWSYTDIPTGTPGVTQQHAFLWTAAGGMQDLNKLVINPPAGGYLLEARAINTRGQIVGSTYLVSTNKTRAFLLTPVNPTPPLLELLLLFD